MPSSQAFTDDALLSLKQIVGDRKNKTAGLIPVGPTTWWNGVKSGRFPRPVRISAQRVAWRWRDIKATIEGFGQVA